MATMVHEGYLAILEIDEHVDLIRGRVVNAHAMLTFHGRTAIELRKAFHDTVAAYRITCQERGVDAEPPYSGTLSLQISHERPGLKGLSFNQDLDRLIKELGETFYGQKLSGPLRGRQRYIHALMSLAEFLEKKDGDRAIGRAFFDLAQGLSELDSGIVRHFLRPKQSGSKAVDPDNIWCARAFLSIAIDLLVSQGASRKDAARQIAAKVEPWLPILTKSNGKYPSVLEKWYESFLKQTVKSRGARILFNERQRRIDRYRDYLSSRTTSDLVESRIVDNFLREASAEAALAATLDQMKAVSPSRTKTL